MQIKDFTTYFPHITFNQLGKLEALAEQIRLWNNRINLISRKDIDHLNEHHILHSLSIIHHFSFVPGTKIVDVGTGGGFPGLIMAIMFPEVEFKLLDSTRKKIQTVEAIAEELGLKNVSPIWQRAEEHTNQYDFVFGRAVASLSDFYILTRHLIHSNNQNNFPNGIIYLKGGDLTNELKELDNSKIKVYKIHDFIPIPFFETKLILYLRRYT